MLTLEECRRIDPSLADVSDDELLIVIERLYGLANIALDIWQEKGGSKIPFGYLGKTGDPAYHV